MQIHLNTDNHVVGSDALAAHLEVELRSALGRRFADRITRVEVHLNDVNSGKGGGADKRCMMEARPQGRQPVSVSHQAPTIALALSGAVEKLERALDRVYGRIVADRRTGVKPVADDMA